MSHRENGPDFEVEREIRALRARQAYHQTPAEVALDFAHLEAGDFYLVWVAASLAVLERPWDEP